MMVTLATACSSSSSFMGVTFPASAPNYGTKIGVGTKTNLRRRIEANKHDAAAASSSSSSGGGLQVKANASINSSQVFAKSTTTFQDEDDEGLVFRQKFSVRSYEVDANRTTSIETLLNYFQESAINHFKRAGLHREGFGSTEEMIKRNLIWVFTQMQVVAYRYPTWGDDVEVETWFSESGKNAVRWNWLLRDFKTDQVLTRASSVCVMMNKLTRRLSKIPEEARREFESYFVNSAQILEDDDDDYTTKLPKLDHNTADYIHTGLTPRWSDLDMNLHVNNVKYIGWILESVPRSILLKCELSAMRLEYRRECGEDSKLQSLTSLVSEEDNIGQNGHIVECNHLLRLEDGAEIVRGKTEWRPKLPINFGSDEVNHPLL